MINYKVKQHGVFFINKNKNHEVLLILHVNRGVWGLIQGAVSTKCHSSHFFSVPTYPLNVNLSNKASILSEKELLFIDTHSYSQVLK